MIVQRLFDGDIRLIQRLTVAIFVSAFLNFSFHAYRHRKPFMSFPPAIFIMGPTASGKSRVALDIAAHFPVEIVSVDSAQVYRLMDIGTA